jgi:hypothetical protein
MADDRGARISGAIFLDQIAHLTEQHGANLLQTALATLPEKNRAEYASVLPMSWVSVETSTMLKLKVAELLGEDPILFQRKLVRAATERSVTRFWRMLIQHVSDEGLIKRTPLLYSKVFDCGEMTAKLIAPGNAVLAVRGWTSIPDFDLEGLGAGIDTVLRVSGRKDTRIRWERQLGGARFIVMWRR